MDIQNLQSQMLKVLFEMGNRQNNFSRLNKLIESVWAQPEVFFFLYRC